MSDAFLVGGDLGECTAGCGGDGLESSQIHAADVVFVFYLLRIAVTPVLSVTMVGTPTGVSSQLHASSLPGRFPFLLIGEIDVDAAVSGYTCIEFLSFLGQLHRDCM